MISELNKFQNQKQNYIKKKKTHNRTHLTQFAFQYHSLMSTESNLVNKIKSIPYEASDNTLNSKIQTLKVFISDTKQKSPEFTAEIEGQNIVHTHLRNYFTDSGQILFFLNPKAPENYLKSKQFQSQAQFIFTQFIKTNPDYSPQASEAQPKKPTTQTEHETTTQVNPVNNSTENTNPSKQQSHKQETPAQKILEKPKLTYPQIQFVKLLQFWLEKESYVHIFYEKYFDTVQKSVQNFQKKLYTEVSKNVSQIPSLKKMELQEKKQQPKDSKENHKAKEPEQTKSTQKKQEVKNEEKQKIVTEKERKVSKKQEKAPVKEVRNSVRPRKTLQKQSQAMKQKEESQDQIQQSQKSLQIQQKQSNYEQNFQQQPQQISENRVESRELTHSQAILQKAIPKDNFNYFLRKFYDHYCKKYINTIKNQQFEKLGDFYHSMNLTKFMVYVKDVKLLKLQKSLTAKFLQQQFKAQENQKHCLQYEGFAKIVMLSLQAAFKRKDLIETEGYEQIGVFNRQNFASVMGKLGVIVPLKKIVFTKLQDVRSLSKMVKSITKQQIIHLKQSKVTKQNKPLTQQPRHIHGQQSNWDSNKLHPDLFLNQKQRKQQRLLQGLTIPKLNKLRPSKHMDEKLHEMVDEDYDPYLKRYNERNNKSAHESNGGHGMMKRIDERIHNVVKRIR